MPRCIVHITLNIKRKKIIHFMKQQELNKITGDDILLEFVELLSLKGGLWKIIHSSKHSLVTQCLSS